MKEKIVGHWIEQEILFPGNMEFTKFGKDTSGVFWLNRKGNGILVYADSAGCLDCRLQLGKWKSIINELKSISSSPIPVLFYLNSTN